MFGKPPSRPISLLSGAPVTFTIHLGFPTAATVAPTVSSTIVLVFAGWTTFFIWCRWMARAEAVVGR